MIFIIIDIFYNKNHYIHQIRVAAAKKAITKKPTKEGFLRHSVVTAI